MKKILLLIGLFTTIHTYSQKLPVEAVTMEVTKTGFYNITSGFIDIQVADTTSFWVAYTSALRGHYSSFFMGNLTFLLKDNNSLQTIDSITFEGKAYLFNIESDEAGNLYAAGYIRDSLDFGNGIKYFNPGTGTHFLMKLDKNMQIQWVNDSIDVGYVTVTPDGNTIYARGQQLSGNYETIFKLNAAGKVVQSKTYSDIGRLEKLKAAPNGDLYFTGGCSSMSGLLDTIPISHHSVYSMYYGKMSANFVMEWFKLFDDITCEKPNIYIGSSGDIALLSPLNKDFSVNGTTVTANSGSGNDFIFLTNTAGGNITSFTDVPAGHQVQDWEFRGLSGNENIAALLLKQKNIDTIQWGAGFETYSMHTGSPIILEFDITSGAMLGAWSFPVGHETPRTILMLNDGSLLVTGTTLNTELYTSTDTIPASSSHYYLKKWRDTTPQPVSVTEKEEPSTIKIYPNPSAGKFEFTEPVTGKIYNFSGQQVITLNGQRSVDLSLFAPGLYVMHTEEGSILKLIKK